MTQLHADQVAELIRMEYAELPGLKLTVGQAQRLWGVSIDLCTSALQRLTERQFLVRNVEGIYMRAPQPGPDSDGRAARF